MKTPAQSLGLEVGDYVVFNSSGDFNGIAKGQEAMLVSDDASNNPLFQVGVMEVYVTLTDKSGNPNFTVKGSEVSGKAKPVTMCVAHRLVSINAEISALQEELCALEKSLAEREGALKSLMEEYGVEG